MSDEEQSPPPATLTLDDPQPVAPDPTPPEPSPPVDFGTQDLMAGEGPPDFGEQILTRGGLPKDVEERIEEIDRGG